MQKMVSAFVVIVCAAGCVVPLPSKVTAGHKYSKQEIAFLDLPNSTRAEVLSTLGEPLVEIGSPGVLLYTWEKTTRVKVYPPDDIGGVHLDAHPSTIKGDPQEWGLFIAYDERGYVTAHEVRRIGTTELTEACVQWRQSKIQNQR
jgi:hypothetical protein